MKNEESDHLEQQQQIPRGSNCGITLSSLRHHCMQAIDGGQKIRLKTKRMDKPSYIVASKLVFFLQSRYAFQREVDILTL